MSCPMQNWKHIAVIAKCQSSFMPHPGLNWPMCGLATPRVSHIQTIPDMELRFTPKAIYADTAYSPSCPNGLHQKHRVFLLWYSTSGPEVAKFPMSLQVLVHTLCSSGGPSIISWNLMSAHICWMISQTFCITNRSSLPHIKRSWNLGSLHSKTKINTSRKTNRHANLSRTMLGNLPTSKGDPPSQNRPHEWKRGGGQTGEPKLLHLQNA